MKDKDLLIDWKKLKNFKFHKILVISLFNSFESYFVKFKTNWSL